MHEVVGTVHADITAGLSFILLPQDPTCRDIFTPFSEFKDLKMRSFILGMASIFSYSRCTKMFHRRVPPISTRDFVADKS